MLSPKRSWRSISPFRISPVFLAASPQRIKQDNSFWALPRNKNRSMVFALRGRSDFQFLTWEPDPIPARITEVARRTTLGGTCFPYEMELHGRRPARFLRRSVRFHDVGRSCACLCAACGHGGPAWATKGASRAHSTSRRLGYVCRGRHSRLACV